MTIWNHGYLVITDCKLIFKIFLLGPMLSLQRTVLRTYKLVNIPLDKGISMT